MGLGWYMLLHRTPSLYTCVSYSYIGQLLRFCAFCRSHTVQEQYLTETLVTHSSSRVVAKSRIHTANPSVLKHSRPNTSVKPQNPPQPQQAPGRVRKGLH